MMFALMKGQYCSSYAGWKVNNNNNNCSSYIYDWQSKAVNYYRPYIYQFLEATAAGCRSRPLE